MNPSKDRVPLVRRWRVRHSYPQPVVELVLRLMPRHGAVALSRWFDIPTSVIYRWREKNRDGACTSPEGESDALEKLIARCAELGFPLHRDARAANGHSRPLANDSTQPPASRDSSRHGAESSPSSRISPQSALRDRRDLANEHDAPRAALAADRSARSHAPRQRYVFDASRERPARAVRSRMEAVRQAIDARYYLDVDCRALAEAAGMSLHHFIRVFSDMFGLSPHLYLTRTRVEAAKRLLLASSEPIDVIATGVGFRSGPSLNRAFKRIEGASVSKYCQTLRKGDDGASWRASSTAVAAGDSSRVSG